MKIRAGCPGLTWLSMEKPMPGPLTWSTSRHDMAQFPHLGRAGPRVHGPWHGKAPKIFVTCWAGEPGLRHATARPIYINFLIFYRDSYEKIKFNP